MVKHVTTWLYLTAPILILLSAPSLVLFPTTHGKTLLWVFVVSVLTVGYLMISRPLTWHVSRLSMVIGLWITSMIISTIFGIDPVQSLWGTDVRGFGVWVWVWLCVYFMALTNMLSGNEGTRAKQIYLGSVLIFGILALLPAISEIAREGIHRVVGTFGNPLLFANAVLFPLFFGLYVTLSRREWWWRAAGLTAVASGVVGVVLSQSRGAFIAMIVGLLVTAGSWFLGKVERKKAVGATVVIVVMLMGGYLMRTTTPMRAIGLDRAFSVLSFDASTSQRFILWNTALQALSERPFLGWGPENFDYAFDQYFNPKNVDFGLTQTWSDRAHNVFLDVLVMQGIAGGLVWLALIGYASVAANNKRKEGDRAYAAFIGLIAAYVVQSLTAFDGPATAVLWMGTLAFVGADTGKKYVVSRNISYVVMLVSVVAMIGTMGVIGRAYNTSRHMVGAENAADAQTRLSSIEQALSVWSPHKPSLRQRAANLLFEHAQRGQQQEAAAQLQAGIEIMQEGISQHPYRFSYVFTLGNILTKAAFILDPQFAQQADEVLRAATELSPRRTAVYFQRANLRVLTGDGAGALEILDEALRVYPESKQAQYMRGVALLYTDHTEEGLESINKGITGAYAFMPTSIDELDQVLRVALVHGDMRVASQMIVLLTLWDTRNDERWYNLKQIAREDGVDTAFMETHLREIQKNINEKKLGQQYQNDIDEVRNILEQKKGLP